MAVFQALSLMLRPQQGSENSSSFTYIEAAFLLENFEERCHSFFLGLLSSGAGDRIKEL